MSDAWLDEPIEFFIPLVQCSKGYWENGLKKGCARLLTIGGPRSITPRQAIERVQSSGWTAEIVGEGRVKFTCDLHILERLAEL